MNFKSWVLCLESAQYGDGTEICGGQKEQVREEPGETKGAAIGVAFQLTLPRPPGGEETYGARVHAA